MPSVAPRTWSCFVRVAQPYFTLDARRQALGLLAALFALLLILSGLNVAISYVGRDFMTALANRHASGVYQFALLYLGVFAASATAGAFARFCELLLGLRWREWLTRRFVRQYLSSQAYFHLNTQAEVDNPDERIAEDLKTFTTTTLSFVVMATNSLITVVAFVGVLWSITPWLLVAATLYPLLGTGLIVLLGRQLVPLNNLQLKKEADFRFELVHVRTHADSVAMVQSEPKEEARLGNRLSALVDNFRSIITVLRNLEFVRGGYNYLDQLIPVLIVAPLYMRGEIEFGVITQASMVFSQIFNAFSIIAEKFQDLSTFAAVIGRVGALDEAMTGAADVSRRPIEVAEEEAPLAYRQVTLRAAKDDRPLVQDLSLEVPRGRRVLLTGPSAAAKHALVRASAGLWGKGSGHIRRPARPRVMFLPEQPYLFPGSLRELFQAAAGGQAVADDQILDVLRQVHLDGLVEQLGGLDVERDWGAILSLREQQALAFARLLAAKPDLAFLDYATSSLGASERGELYRLLAASGISYLSVGDREPSLLECHDTLLELRPDGTWSAEPIRPEGAAAST